MPGPPATAPGADEPAEREAKEMRRDYTKIGEREGFTREAVDRGIETVTEWEPPSGRLPMMQGMAIREFIKSFRVPKVSYVAVFGSIRSGAGDELGLYGIKAHYKTEDVTFYIADSGTHITPVAADISDAQ